MLMLLVMIALVLVIGLGIVVISITIAHWNREDGVPKDRPVWMGPDPVEIEQALRALVLERRAAAGAGPVGDHQDVVELARVHAHDMAVRHFSGEVDPDGQGLTERRVRLTLKLVGEAAQWQTLLIPEASRGAEAIARDLLPIDKSLADLVAEPRWNELGVGVAIEDGRCGACVVFAARAEAPT